MFCEQYPECPDKNGRALQTPFKVTPKLYNAMDILHKTEFFLSLSLPIYIWDSPISQEFPYRALHVTTTFSLSQGPCTLLLKHQQDKRCSGMKTYYKKCHILSEISPNNSSSMFLKKGQVYLSIFSYWKRYFWVTKTVYLYTCHFDK